MRGKKELGGFGEDREKWLGEGEKVDSLQNFDQVPGFVLLSFVPLVDCAANSQLRLEN